MPDFFETVGPHMKAFARRHNVRLEPWLKDVDIWSLSFKHPSGGSALVNVSPGVGDRAVVESSWHRDDYDSESRRIAWGTRHEIAAVGSDFADGLREELRRVLSWTDADLGEPSKMTPGVWHSCWSKEAFERLGADLPVPRL